jgi:hypothetical protein
VGTAGLLEQRIGECGDQLDQIDLMIGAGLSGRSCSMEIFYLLIVKYNQKVTSRRLPGRIAELKKTEDQRAVAHTNYLHLTLRSSRFAHA